MNIFPQRICMASVFLVVIVKLADLSLKNRKGQPAGTLNDILVEEI